MEIFIFLIMGAFLFAVIGVAFTAAKKTENF
jgi:hypothetical protein